MVESVWTAQHAATLRGLREAARLDVAVLAKRHNLSTTQVRQLEEGGESAFYSPQIKLAVGRKLTLALGGTFVDAAPEVETPASPVPSPVTPVVVAPATPTPVADALLSVPGVRGHQNDPTSRPPRQSRVGLLILGLGLAVAAGLTWTVSGPWGVKPTPAMSPTVAPSPAPSTEANDARPAALAPDASPSQPVTDISTAPKEDPGITMPPPRSAPAAPMASESQACRWVANPPDMTPSAGNRPGNYVHVVALQTTEVCWRDADKKTHQQTLQAQEGVSFWGRAPFQVYVSNPSTLKVYFKGQAVRWPVEAEPAHIVLGSPAGSVN